MQGARSGSCCGAGASRCRSRPGGDGALRDSEPRAADPRASRAPCLSWRQSFADVFVLVQICRGSFRRCFSTAVKLPWQRHCKFAPWPSASHSPGLRKGGTGRGEGSNACEHVRRRFPTVPVRPESEPAESEPTAEPTPEPAAPEPGAQQSPAVSAWDALGASLRTAYEQLQRIGFPKEARTQAGPWASSAFAEWSSGALRFRSKPA